MEVTIEGHCDDRGTNEYNMALGDRRPEAQKTILSSWVLQETGLETVSYGEGKNLLYPAHRPKRNTPETAGL